jgi:hypothetical protein
MPPSKKQKCSGTLVIPGMGGLAPACLGGLPLALGFTIVCAITADVAPLP